MRTSRLVLCVLAVACGPAAPAPEVSDPPSVTVAEAPSASAENVFDAGTLEIGDTVVGLSVVSKDVERVFEDSVWVGEVEFAGDLVVQGVYQPHPDWPSVTAACFHVNDPASAARVPRFLIDERTTQTMKTWFCFSDPAIAVEMLGSPEQPRELVIAVDHYRVSRHFSDVFDTAELMELIDQGPAAPRTLLEP